MMDRNAASIRLGKKLDPAHVKGRQQGGTTVQYIEGWHAIAEANAIFGHFDWTRELLDLRMVSERERPVGRDKRDGWAVSYIARVRVTVDGVIRDGMGAGHGIGVDLGECHESAVKEAETDAMKRALATFGWRFGLALYDKGREHVGVDVTPEQKRDWFLKAVAAAPNLARLVALEASKKAQAELASLPEPMRAQVKAAMAKRRRELGDAGENEEPDDHRYG